MSHRLMSTTNVKIASKNERTMRYYQPKFVPGDKDGVPQQLPVVSYPQQPNDSGDVFCAHLPSSKYLASKMPCRWHESAESLDRPAPVRQELVYCVQIEGEDGRPAYLPHRAQEEIHEQRPEGQTGQHGHSHQSRPVLLLQQPEFHLSLAKAYWSEG